MAENYTKIKPVTVEEIRKIKFKEPLNKKIIENINNLLIKRYTTYGVIEIKISEIIFAENLDILIDEFLIQKIILEYANAGWSISSSSFNSAAVLSFKKSEDRSGGTTWRD